VADEKSWSADGRPGWLRDRCADVTRILLIVFCVELPSVYRCIAVVFTTGTSAWTFTIDVGFEDFDKLLAVSGDALLALTHSLLHHFPTLPPDPDQEERWRALERDRDVAGPGSESGPML
jgi:hypothetical protein